MPTVLQIVHIILLLSLLGLDAYSIYGYLDSQGWLLNDGVVAIVGCVYSGLLVCLPQLSSLII